MRVFPFVSPELPAFPAARPRARGGPGIVPLFAACAAALLWPAVWNGYPIVFADTGTYLSQAMHRYLGWDRPVFYSLFIWPLHLGRSIWPVVLVQSGLAVFVLDLTRRAFGLPGAWLVPLTLFLALFTWMPWMVSELMPDLFTPLLVLLLGALVFTPERFRPFEYWGMIVLAAFMIATQQSSVLLSLTLLGFAIPARWVANKHWGQRRVLSPAPLLAPAAAIIALMAVNLAGHGRLSISPYGNVFLLARVIYDGPGMDILRRDCPDQAWRLCPWLDQFPAISDEFLWDKTSPILRAGGHKAVAADADAIVTRAVLAEPARLLAAAGSNAWTQLLSFESGDGLEAWPDQAGIRIDQDFPDAEQIRFHGARQQNGTLAVPWWLPHHAAALAGIAAAIGLLPLMWRRRDRACLFLALSLVTLPGSAAITGALSTPHDRYQSRIVWLPALTALLTGAGLGVQSRARDPVSRDPASREGAS